MAMLSTAAGASPGGAPETRYLAFQLFTRSADGAATRLLPPAAPDAFVDDLVARIGPVGRPGRRLAVVFGPLALDDPDDAVRRLVQNAFSIALRRDVAIGFHLDDSMFWDGRKDLRSDPENVEWQDWAGTPSTGRRLDWGPRPTKIAPQLCFNSAAVRAAVGRRAVLIGAAIRQGRARLRRRGKDDLFAGVIVGWETQIGQDFDSGRALGYHALANRGFRKDRPPLDPDREREAIVREWIGLWSAGLASAGVPRDRLYAHVAFVPHRLFDASDHAGESYAVRNHFAPPDVAFGDGCRPGFTTYPQPGLFEEIDAERHRHGDPPWASSEGTNLQIGAGPGGSGMGMESYLARMFDHGATLVNLFSWGVGGEANRKMDFRIVTEGDEAIAAYRKFLRGDRLVETASVATTVQERLPAKIHRIQRELPAWVGRTGRQSEIEPLMKRLDAALKANDLVGAERVADLVLGLLAKESLATHEGLGFSSEKRRDEALSGRSPIVSGRRFSRAVAPLPD